MRRTWILVFAPLLVASTAAAQDFPPVPLPPVAVPVPWPIPVPSPYPAPSPAPYPEAPPPLPPPVWQYPQELPPPPPPPAKKTRGVLLAADFGAALPIRSPDTKTAGFGGDFRVGYRFGSTVWVAPEATVGSVGFPRYDMAIRFGLGGHLGLDAGLVEPSIYAFGGGFWNVFKQGMGLRTGAALDFRAGRFVLPGVHVDYNYAGWDTGSVRYVSPGVHVGFLVGR